MTPSLSHMSRNIAQSMTQFDQKVEDGRVEYTTVLQRDQLNDDIRRVPEKILAI